MKESAGLLQDMIVRMTAAVGGETPNSVAVAQMNRYPAPQLRSFVPFPASLDHSKDVVPFFTTTEGRSADLSDYLEERRQPPDQLWVKCSSFFAEHLFFHWTLLTQPGWHNNIISINAAQTSCVILLYLQMHLSAA